MNCKFKLKSGALLIDATGRLPEATAANLTDEIAIAYLRDNIKRADMFEELPENIEELLSEEEKAEGDGGVSNGSESFQVEKGKGSEDGKPANEEGKNADGSHAAEENEKPKK